MQPVIVFDVNGTLLDIEALAPHIRRIFGRKLSVDAWFTKVIQYSMATSLAGTYEEFGQIAMAVLEMSAAGEGIRLSRTQREKVKNGMKKLPAFPEVKKALGRLQGAGFRLAVLTNSGRESLKEQLQRSGLQRYFEEAFSVDAVRQYKPARDPYRAAAHFLGVDPHQMLMVAAHPWDLLGAARAGCRTAFLARPGKAVFSEAPLPEYIAANLKDLADRLLAEKGLAQPPEKRTAGLGLALTGCGLAVGAAGGALARVMRRM